MRYRIECDCNTAQHFDGLAEVMQAAAHHAQHGHRHCNTTVTDTKAKAGTLYKWTWDGTILERITLVTTCERCNERQEHNGIAEAFQHMKTHKDLCPGFLILTAGKPTPATKTVNAT